MVMTPKDALLQAQEALAVEWTGDQQVNAVAGTVEKLAEGLSSAESLLRTVQVLWLPEGGRDRASARYVLSLLRETSNMLAQGPSALGWAKVVAWAALRISLEKDPDVAAVISLMRSAAEWTSAPSRYQTLIHEIINAARTFCVPQELPASFAFEPSMAWPTPAAISKATAAPGGVKVLEVWTADPGNLHQSVFALIMRDDALFNAVKSIENHLAKPSSAPIPTPDSLEFLWWGQSLYSSTLHKSYRELPLNQRLLWMANDLAWLGSEWPSEQRMAYFVETLRRVDFEIGASCSLREYAADTIASSTIGGQLHMPGNALMAAIEADPTALPITFLTAQARKGVPKETLLTELQGKLDMDLDREIQVRQWATWVCRERQLLRFLQDEVAT